MLAYVNLSSTKQSLFFQQDIFHQGIKIKILLDSEISEPTLCQYYLASVANNLQAGGLITRLQLPPFANEAGT